MTVSKITKLQKGGKQVTHELSATKKAKKPRKINHMKQTIQKHRKGNTENQSKSDINPHITPSKNESNTPTPGI